MASKTEGRWITIGGRRGPNGKRRGGSPVFIQGGRITKGHPSFTGRSIKALGTSSPADHGTHRQQLRQGHEYERARLFKRARAAGINPDHVRQLAGEILEHRKAFDHDRGRLLRDARQALASFGGQWRTLKQNADHGRVEGADQVKGLDVVADDMARAYPHLFHGNDNPAEQLYGMLVEGNHDQAGEQQALEEAFDHLLEEHERYRVRDDEAVPFSLDMETPMLFDSALEFSLTMEVMRGRLARAEGPLARKELGKVRQRLRSLVETGGLSRKIAEGMWRELRAREMSLMDPGRDNRVSKILAQIEILERTRPKVQSEPVYRGAFPKVSREQAGQILDSVYGG